MNWKLRTISFFFLLGIISSCEYETIPPTEITGEVSFQQEIMPIFDQSCNSGKCHSSNGIPPVLYDSAVTYQILINTPGMVDTANVEESILYARMVDTKKPMPPGGVDSYAAELVKAWIEQGANNN